MIRRRGNPYTEDTGLYRWYDWGYLSVTNKHLVPPVSGDTSYLRAFEVGRETKVKEELTKLLDVKRK